MIPGAGAAILYSEVGGSSVAEKVIRRNWILDSLRIYIPVGPGLLIFALHLYEKKAKFTLVSQCYFGFAASCGLILTNTL